MTDTPSREYIIKLKIKTQSYTAKVFASVLEIQTSVTILLDIVEFTLIEEHSTFKSTTGPDILHTKPNIGSHIYNKVKIQHYQLVYCVYHHFNPLAYTPILGDLVGYGRVAHFGVPLVMVVHIYSEALYVCYRDAYDL